MRRGLVLCPFLVMLAPSLLTSTRPCKAAANALFGGPSARSNYCAPQWRAGQPATSWSRLSHLRRWSAGKESLRRSSMALAGHDICTDDGPATPNLTAARPQPPSHFTRLITSQSRLSIRCSAHQKPTLPKVPHRALAVLSPWELSLPRSVLTHLWTGLSARPHVHADKETRLITGAQPTKHMFHSPAALPLTDSSTACSCSTVWISRLAQTAIDWLCPQCYGRSCKPDGLLAGRCRFSDSVPKGPVRAAMSWWDFDQGPVSKGTNCTVLDRFRAEAEVLCATCCKDRVGTWVQVLQVVYKFQRSRDVRYFVLQLSHNLLPLSSLLNRRFPLETSTKTPRYIYHILRPLTPATVTGIPSSNTPFLLTYANSPPG